MKEDFLHYLWKYDLYAKPLKLISGEFVEVLNPGEHNTDAGPDFFNAKIKIGETIWAGNVEMHVKASDWIKHQHQHNEAYNNVILHVVASADTAILQNNVEIPTLELKAPESIFKQYLYLMQTKAWVPCENFISKINEFTIFQSKEALLVERLHQKSEIIAERLKANGNNWEETFYQTLAYNFGFKTNSQPFEMLAKSIPLIYLGKHKDQLPLIEAMLFGQSGLLPEKGDAYIEQLKTDYLHLGQKFLLKPISGSLWKFMRLRPANFPTIRIAQFASLIHNSAALFSKIISAKNVKDIELLFNVSASEYWERHYSFRGESKKAVKNLGFQAIYNIILNTIVTTLFYYGQQKNNELYIERAIQFCSELPAEENTIISNWKKLGINAENAFDSQALIQLKNVYCKKRQCLNCRIGNQIIKHVV